MAWKEYKLNLLERAQVNAYSTSVLMNHREEWMNHTESNIIIY